MTRGRVYETDVADVIARFWMERGYRVHAEVEVDPPLRFDLVAIHEDEGDVVIVETKTTFSQSVRVQAARAVPYARAVFVGIPQRKTRITGKHLAHAPYGILEAVIGSGDVIVSRSAPRSNPPEGVSSPYDAASRIAGTILACSKFNAWEEGAAGASTIRGERVMTQSRQLVLAIHARLWVEESPMHPGEILDAVPAVRGAFRIPIYGLRDLLEREPAFSIDVDSGGWVATGIGVPEIAKPRRASDGES